MSGVLVRRIFGRKQPSFAGRWRWSRLAAYNAEVARGIVHTEAWDRRMAEEQAEFNETYRPGLHLPGDRPGPL